MPTEQRGGRRQDRRQGRLARYGWSLAVLVAALVVVGGVGVVMTKGVGPIPGQERCVTTVNGQRVVLDLEQARNASLIAAIGVERGLPARAVSIALATAYQESKIYNLDHGDRDSLGLFQQRPSQGWGTIAQVRDPHYSINAFYDGLEKVDGYEQMRITEAAQRVQRSGYPEAYEPHAADARALASALTGYSAGGRFSCLVKDRDPGGTAAETTADLRAAYGEDLDVTPAGRQDVTVAVPDDEDGLRLGWSVAQYLVGHASVLGLESVAYDGKVWEVGERGWSESDAADAGRVRVSLG